MIITDELRKAADDIASTAVPCGASPDYIGVRRKIYAIADRIDAEHQKAIHELNGLAEVSVLLPRDADGEPWHVGDRTESGQTIQAMGLNKHGWYFIGTVNDIDPRIHRHHRAPTVEDVLREFGIDWEHESDCEDRAALLKEYAKRLTLAEEDA